MTIVLLFYAMVITNVSPLVELPYCSGGVMTTYLFLFYALLAFSSFRIAPSSTHAFLSLVSLLVNLLLLSPATVVEPFPVLFAEIL